jgi:small multidrug resistance family-3 protein
MSLLRFHTSSLSDTTVAAPTKKMDPATTYVVIVALFAAAGVLEIGGGWMWWQALREGKPWWYALIGSAMLCLYGVVPTFQPQTAGTEDFGRVYAAYGCWFIMLSLAWGWAVDGNRPDAGDGIGAGLAAVGAVVITFYPRR